MSCNECSTIRIFPDPASLSRGAAELFVKSASAAVRARGVFTVALCGGTTPRRLYRDLAAPEVMKKIPWTSVHLFWGDERCVSPEDEESNFGMARDLLLGHVPIPESNIHRMRGEMDPREGARCYEEDLRAFFPDVSVPVLDLILLGVGRDGHVASLFPDSETLRVKNRLVTVAAAPGKGLIRLSLTFPVINQARTILFLVSGERKSEVLARVFSNRGISDDLPVRFVRPVSGGCLWFVDKAAAGRLKQ